MNNPKISWQVLDQINDDEYDYMSYKTYTEESSFIPGEYIEKTFRVWNNYAGSNEVKEAKDCVLVIAFKTYEDIFLLNNLKIKLDSSDDFVDPDIDIDRAFIEIGNLSGVANSGFNAYSNYKEFSIKIGPIPTNIKSNLRSLYFYLEYTNE